MTPRAELFDRELARLTRRIDFLSKAEKGMYSTGAKQRIRTERDSLILERVALRTKRKVYLMRSTNPIENTWNWLRSHPFWVLVIAFAGPMIMAGPQAMAGFAMIVGTLWFLLACFRGIKRHYAPPSSKGCTQIEVPGGILEVQGHLTPERATAIQREWETAARSGGAKVMVVGSGTQFTFGGPIISEQVSAMHADDAPYTVDDTVDGVHPRLPAWMRTAWDGALAEYRTRVGVEGIKYRDLKERFSELYRSVLDRDSMIDWAHRRVEPSHTHEPVDVSTLQRIERGLEAISPEGARYGELLFRAQRGEDIGKYATEDGEIIVKNQRATPSPEMPRDFIPMLDRTFELTTDCRYHHVAEHALVETAAHPGYVVRTCTVCSPATFWIERA